MLIAPVAIMWGKNAVGISNTYFKFSYFSSGTRLVEIKNQTSLQINSPIYHQQIFYSQNLPEQSLKIILFIFKKS